MPNNFGFHIGYQVCMVTATMKYSLRARQLSQESSVSNYI